MIFDYFLQDDASQSLRRYPAGAESGERWAADKKEWTPQCAPRRACELTGDTRIAFHQLRQEQR